jgi:hypothetical protein
MQAITRSILESDTDLPSKIIIEASKKLRGTKGKRSERKKLLLHLLLPLIS